MPSLLDLKPRRHERIMDVAEAAGLDITDWASSRMGAANPKYCYEWAFASPDRSKILLCLWHGECEAAGDEIVQRGTIRPLILSLEGEGSPRGKRARKFDELLQDAWRLKTPIRVAMVDQAEKHPSSGPENDFSHAAYRELDPVPWHLDKYDMMTGDYVLRRASIQGAESPVASGETTEPPREKAQQDDVSPPDSVATRPMDYVARVVYSRNGWQRPSGAADEAVDSYASSNGFGHEEWLFRQEWIVGGWRYSFLQGVNRSYSRLRAEEEPFDVTLFTMDPDQGHRYVARMFGVEVLGPAQAEDALQEFKRRGWFDQMADEILAVGGRVAALLDEQAAKQILNIRFRPDRVERLPSMPAAAIDDPIRRIRRYTLCGSQKIGAARASPNGREPSTAAYFRNGTEPRWVTPEHGRMQELLCQELRAEFPGASIRCEVLGIDVLLETDRDRILFEVKSDLCPRRVIREALGQVLEYAYYRPETDEKALRLVLVGRSPAGTQEMAYLSMLRSQFSIPVEYRQVSLPDAKSAGPSAEDADAEAALADDLEGEP
jgi:hypothetical protein